MAKVTQEKPLVAVDVSLEKFTVDAEASYRIPDEMVKFLIGLEDKHNVIGFRWLGSYRFDVLLESKVKRTPQAQKPE